MMGTSKGKHGKEGFELVITTAPIPDLNEKLNVFGRVIRGEDVVQVIFYFKYHVLKNIFSSIVMAERSYMSSKLSCDTMSEKIDKYILICQTWVTPNLIKIHKHSSLIYSSCNGWNTSSLLFCCC